MARLYYQSPDAVCGDFMPFGEDGTFYLFTCGTPGGRPFHGQALRLGPAEDQGLCPL